MAEWHQPPDYIVNNWTDELLVLMIEKLVARKQREVEALNHKPGDSTVSAEMLAAQSGGMIEHIKTG